MYSHSRTLWILSLLLFPTATRADWPMARHDPQRTAYVPGTSHITTPGLAWRYYLGGAILPNQYWAGVLDGSGHPTIIYTAGGKLIAKHPDDTVIWETPPMLLEQVFDVWDVDGDGTLDIVVGGNPNGVYIFNSKTGALEWTLPVSAGITILPAFGQQPAVRSVDLDGDGKRDLYIGNDACSSSTLPACNEEVAYSFAGGFGNATQLWAIGPGVSAAYGGAQDVIADFEGNGGVQAARVGPNYDLLQLFDGKTGALVATSTQGADGSIAWEGIFDAAPALSGGRWLLLYYEDTSFAQAPGYGGHRVLAYGYDAPSGALVKLWEVDAGTALATDQLAFDATSLGHFDAASPTAWQAALSFYDSTAGTWTLRVIDAASGTVLASLPGAIYDGSAVLTSTGVSSILATNTAGAPIVYGYASGALTAGAALQAAPTRHWDRSLSRWKGLVLSVATTNIGGKPELLAATGEEYEALDVSSGSGSGTEVALYLPGTGTGFLATEVFPDPATGLAQPFLALTTGYLVVLEPTTLLPTNVQGGEFPLFGMTIGGYYTGPSDVGHTPVVGVLSSGAVPSVLVDDCTAGLLRFDPGTTASVVTPPTPVWRLPGTWFPSLVDLDNDGFPEIIAVQGGAVSAVHADGQTTLWSTPVPAGVGLLYDLPYGDANGDGVPDFFFEGATAGRLSEVQAVSGSNGVLLWGPAYSVDENAGEAPLAVADMNGDGKADAVTTIDRVTVLSGPNGAVLSQDPSEVGFAQQLLADVLSSGTPQVYVGAGWFAQRLDLANGSTQWTGSAGEPLGQHYDDHAPGLAPCASGALVLQGQYDSPVLSAYTASTGQLAWSVALAAGQVYANVGAIPSGVIPGVAGNVTVKQDLTGAGHLSALIGSTDGYLYAVQACTGALDWSYSLGFPVGEAVLADTTGGGTDQILVTAADGYLYAINQQAIAQPQFVYAVDPPEGFPHTPVSTITTEETLYAEWASVAGATSYQWAVFTSGGTPVGTAGYQNEPASSGSVVDVTATGLPLKEGGRYFFAVRSVGPNGASSDAISNTVTVHLGTPPGGDGGTGAGDGGASADGGIGNITGHSKGCGCGESGPSAAAWAVLALLGLAARRLGARPA